MDLVEAKADLLKYLQDARDAAVWKLDGVSEYDVRRPMTDSGTNLLGVVKHLACMEWGYFGDTFGRPSGEPMPWDAPDADPNADLWATADESREQIIDGYRRSWAHAAITIDSLELDSRGTVPWWTPGNSPTLQKILVHMIAETHRHAGHLDIVRELIDGGAGISATDSNLPEVDAAYWSTHRERLETLARSFG